MGRNSDFSLLSLAGKKPNCNLCFWFNTHWVPVICQALNIPQTPEKKGQCPQWKTQPLWSEPNRQDSSDWIRKTVSCKFCLSFFADMELSVRVAHWYDIAHSVLFPLFSKTSDLVEVPEEADGPGEGYDLRKRSNSGEWGNRKLGTA